MKLKTFVAIGVTLRMVMAVISKTWHVPDETWQSVEVAHKMVFDRGYLTWEWREGLRSYLHPSIYAILFYILRLFDVDDNEIFIVAPRILQGLISVLGDVAIYKLYKNHFRPQTGIFIIVYLTNWFVNYCSSRTLVNTLEMTVNSIAINFYTERKPIYAVTVALGIVMRPTMAIFWFPLALAHLKDIFALKLSFLKNLANIVPSAVIAVFLAFKLDSYFYGDTTFVPWNFFQWNVLNNVGSFYGVHPWHWYLTQGLPIILGIVGVPFLLHGLYKALRMPVYGMKKRLAVAVVFTVAVYSALQHKEMRFALPLLPVMLCFVANSAATLLSGRSLRHFLALQALLNVPAVIYLSLWHQSGVTTAVSQFASTTYTSSEEISPLFLMPCHSTPYTSHMHAISTVIKPRFLTCEPNLEKKSNYVDEADAFYESPKNWLQREFKKGFSHSHVFLFDELIPKIEEFLQSKGCFEISRFFHTHLPEGRVSSNVCIFKCNKSEGL